MTSIERRDRFVVIVSLLAYLAIGFFPYLVSGLIVPPGAVAVLMVCWFMGLFLTARMATARPLLAPVGVVAAILFWFAFVTLGSSLFGWTA
ncbi:MAG: hypothetical protein HKN03_11990 [Acidimicrobiales bacterium]|nr:hypothetical protein [Acidimicrobiales bacterium]